MDARRPRLFQLMTPPSTRAAPLASALAVALAAATVGIPFGHADDSSSPTSPPDQSPESTDPTLATPPDELVDAADLDPNEILDHFGLEVRDSCRRFPETPSLRERLELWRGALETLATHHPDVVYGWLTGRRRPPDRAIEITLQQRDCLLDALFRDARASDDALVVEVEFDHHDGDDDTITDQDRLRELAEAYSDSDYHRGRIRDALTKSHYRSAWGQAGIWLRKFRFEGGSFNRITAEAAEACDLAEGATWKPGVSSHARCWHGRLDGPQRERQILSASSAPGLSRHHWGTEIDLFSLNPHRFLEGRRRAGEYDWMRQHASLYGFYQPYKDDDAYVEERWHWSYVPIGGALTQFADAHRGELGSRLDDLWDRYQRRLADEDDGILFDYVRRHWPSYVFDVAPPFPD